jgi:hypothetical protein
MFNEFNNLKVAGPEPIIGIVFAKITTAYKKFLPGNSNLAIAYASIKLDAIFTKTRTAKIHKELYNIPK